VVKRRTLIKLTAAFLLAWALLLFGATAGHGQGCTYYSYVLDKTYVVEVTDKALRATPSWDADKENPPLPARKALQLANRKKDQLVKDTTDFTWALESASLIADRDGKWYWLVHYTARVRQGGFSGIRPFLLLAVLMDGTVVEPRLVKGK
jgi:hypothetical protein